jgi:RNA polymerase sigma-70 factor, ECF subfamily
MHGAFQEEKGSVPEIGEGVSEAVLPFDARPEGTDLPAEHGWVERARAGDLEAFDQIMIQYEHRLQRFLYGLVGDVDTAQELCQETFLAAYRSLPRVKGEMKLSGWLHTIALNQARSHYRRQRTRFHLPLGEHDVPDKEPDVQESIANRDLVEKILARLPHQYSEPLLLQLSGGLSCREIAKITGGSEGAVKVRLLRAREAFRRAYAAEVGE